MEISKVKSVVVGNSYTNQHGEMFNHNYLLTDGQKIQASHKTQLPIKEGEEVEYEVKRSHPTYGDSGTVKKVSNDFGKGKKVVTSLKEIKGKVKSNAIHAIVTVNSNYGEERLKGDSLSIIEAFTIGSITEDIDKFGEENRLLTGRLAAVNNACIASGYISVNNAYDIVKLAKKYFKYTNG